RKIGITFEYSITSTPLILKPPAWARAAPINPPIKVCEEEEGIPNFHVNRFHKIAAINPAKITSKVINCSLTDLAIVLPILNSPIIYNEIKYAAKLKAAAQSTA